MAEKGAAVEASMKRGRSSSEIIKQFNATNAKLLAVLLVFCMLGYHAILKGINGSDNCQWMLTKGRYQGNNIWQPYGCMIHTYSQTDAYKCMRSAGILSGERNHWVFVGDSRIRQLYFEVIKLVDPEAVPVIIKRDEWGDYFKFLLKGTPSTEDVDENKSDDPRPLEKAHRSLSFNSTVLSLRMAFFWRPIFNGSAADLLVELRRSPNVPRILVAGGGAWNIKLSNGSDESLDQYARNLEEVVKAVDDWPASSRLLWKLQDPVDSEKLSESRQVITNKLIDSYNDVARQILQPSRFHIWQSARLITETMTTDPDGLHLSHATLKHHAQLLFNMYCNEWMYYDDGTCCRAAETTTMLQIITFTILLLCLNVAVTCLVYRSVRCGRKKRLAAAASIETLVLDEEADAKALAGNGHVANSAMLVPAVDVSVSARKSAAKDEPSWRVAVFALGKLGLIMAYFYLCDRTSFFMKENKYYSHLNFFLPIGYLLALGLFFNEESRSTRVLHRDQTDEWKGWMQLVILVYHMTGASQVIPLYMQMRFLVSSYLFLTGFGHFSFFWNGGSASFVRLCQVLFRMNLLTIVICLCMNRPYQSYYFVPLVSFWYLVVYIVLALPPKISSSICDANPLIYFYIILKFVTLFACITVLYLSEVFFEQIFLIRPWKALFVTPDDEIHEWWFRWSLDRYSICFGMVFGFVYLNAQKFGIIDDSTRQNLLSRTRMLAVATVAAVLGLGGYTAFTLTCHSKPECNEVHSYVAFVPIVSFIALRNLYGSLRGRYSSLFAWFGRISLELFIGQYHIWLAADTRGVLVLIPDYPVLNVMVTSYILVCVAHEVHLITGQLVSLAVPADWKRALRNVVIFFLALVPIAINDGMF